MGEFEGASQIVQDSLIHAKAARSSQLRAASEVAAVWTVIQVLLWIDRLLAHSDETRANYTHDRLDVLIEAFLWFGFNLIWHGFGSAPALESVSIYHSKFTYLLCKQSLAQFFDTVFRACTRDREWSGLVAPHFASVPRCTMLVQIWIGVCCPSRRDPLDSCSVRIRMSRPKLGVYY